MQTPHTSKSKPCLRKVPACRPLILVTESKESSYSPNGVSARTLDDSGSLALTSSYRDTPSARYLGRFLSVPAKRTRRDGPRGVQGLW